MELYGYVIESRNDLIGPRTNEYLGSYWDRYNRKIYDTEEIARKAWEENPYRKEGERGFMMEYRIIPVYTKNGQTKTNKCNNINALD